MKLRFVLPLLLCSAAIAQAPKQAPPPANHPGMPEPPKPFPLPRTEKGAVAPVLPMEVKYAFLKAAALEATQQRTVDEDTKVLEGFKQTSAQAFQLLASLCGSTAHVEIAQGEASCVLNPPPEVKK